MTWENEVNPPLSEVLEHHGIKGMRWGVRKPIDSSGAGRTHIYKTQNKIYRLNRVARGKASLYDKAQTLGGTSVLNLVKYKGLRGASKAESANLQAHLNRISRGEQTMKDLMLVNRNLTLSDIMGTSPMARSRIRNEQRAFK